VSCTKLVGRVVCRLMVEVLVHLGEEPVLHEHVPAHKGGGSPRKLYCGTVPNPTPFVRAVQFRYNPRRPTSGLGVIEILDSRRRKPAAIAAPRFRFDVASGTLWQESPLVPIRGRAAGVLLPLR